MLEGVLPELWAPCPTGVGPPEVVGALAFPVGWFSQSKQWREEGLGLAREAVLPCPALNVPHSKAPQQGPGPQ